jgi:hypothetical protein
VSNVWALLRRVGLCHGRLGHEKAAKARAFVAMASSGCTALISADTSSYRWVRHPVIVPVNEDRDDGKPASEPAHRVTPLTGSPHTFEHMEGTFEGQIERVSHFATGARGGSGWRRRLGIGACVLMLTLLAAVLLFGAIAAIKDL